MRPESATILARLARPLAFAGLALAPLALPGCATEPTASAVAEGDPPAGYDTWEDYWKARDEEYRDFDHDAERLRMQRGNLGNVARW